MKQGKLKEYAKKRKFDETPEPKAALRKETKKKIFVIQKHDATRLHYDLRLEHNGVLKSFAVTKKPTMLLGKKRLAVMVEDHPFDYKDFEGVIPKGNYGAGPVMVWDNGVYDLFGSYDFDSMLAKGHISFVLLGQKLKGGFDLVRMGDSKNWLLIKKQDEYADRDDFRDDISVKTGWTFKQIETGKKEDDISELLKDAIKTSIPKSVEPMLATLIDKPFDDKNFIYEIKWDGYRAVSIIQNREVNIFSRNLKSFNDKFEPIYKELKDITIDLVLDGEIIAMDQNGKADFQTLQNFEREKIGNLAYIVFDILYYDGFDLKELPLSTRKKILREVVPEKGRIILSDYVIGQGNAFFESAKKLGIEGIIAKNLSSTYRAGTRTPLWLKMKIKKREEAVIVGFTDPRGSRKHFGSLVLVQYKDGKLTYVGNVGGGFGEKTLSDLFIKFKPLIIEDSPFKEKLVRNLHFRAGPQMPITWVKPHYVCEVEYGEKTQEGIYRHPVFLGLREDKNAQEIEIEKPKRSKELISNIHDIKLSNPEKIFFPEKKYTKKDVWDYYQKIAPFILPYLAGRPQSLHRYPDGIYGQRFYHKDIGKIVPPSFETFEDYLEREERTIKYMVGRDVSSLLFMANLGCIEINPWLSTVEAPDNPDFCVIDLDPLDVSFEKVIEVALVVRKTLEELNIPSYPKTSGKKGMHILIPLGNKYSYDESRQFAELLANLVHARSRNITSVERSPHKRKGLVYVDFLQNRRSQTIAAPYSLRPTPLATVSTPLDWNEVNQELKPENFTIKNIFKRLKKTGDIYKGVLREGIDILSVIGKINGFMRYNWNQ